MSGRLHHLATEAFYFHKLCRAIFTAILSRFFRDIEELLRRIDASITHINTIIVIRAWLREELGSIA